jgi:hypothetical protein
VATYAPRILVFCALILTIVSQAETPTDHWDRVFPYNPTSTNGLSFANGKFYLSATPPNFQPTPSQIFSTVVYSSTNGFDWSPDASVPSWPAWVWLFGPFGDKTFVSFRTSPTVGEAAWLRSDGTVDYLGRIAPSTIRDICLHNGVYFATCVSETTLQCSEDGRVWTEVPGRTNGLAVASGAGTLLVTAGIGKVCLSTNGVDWEEIDTGATNSLSTVKYADGRFVAGGFNQLLTSTNGRDWTIASVPISSVRQINYGEGNFVAAGRNGMATSTDGLNWSVSLNYLGLGACLAYGNGIWVARSDVATTYVSEDGLHWRNTTPPFGNYRDLIVWNGQVISANGVITVFTDSQTFSNVYRGTRGVYYSLAHNDSTIVSVTTFADVPIYSTNGFQWFEGTGRSMSDVAFGNGVFIGLYGHNFRPGAGIQKALTAKPGPMASFRF